MAASGTTRTLEPREGGHFAQKTHVITVKIEGSTYPNFDGDTQARALNGDEVTYINPMPSNGSKAAKNIYKRVK